MDSISQISFMSAAPSGAIDTEKATPDHVSGRRKHHKWKYYRYFQLQLYIPKLTLFQFLAHIRLSRSHMCIFV